MGKKKGISDKRINGEKYHYVKGYKKKSDAQKWAKFIRGTDRRNVRVIKNPRKNWPYPWGVYTGPRKHKRRR